MQDPRFASAPIICSDNVTRHAINKLKVFERAKRLNCPVIAFRLPLSIYARNAFTAASVRLQQTLDSLLDLHDDLTFYFVPGAPVMCKDNTSPSFGIANGTQAVLHSLTLDPAKVNVDDVWIRIQNTPAGKVIYLDQLPLSINITLQNAAQAFDANTSLLSHLQVIPMMLNTRSCRKIKVAGKSKLRNLTFYDFGVDLAFALTYFKVQGLTLDGIILDLDTTVLPRINVAAMYVGLSRVRSGNHIRILPIKENSLLALNRLQFAPYLIQWLEGSSRI